MRWKASIYLSVLAFILTGCFSFYLYLSVPAGRPITGSEFARFFRAISLNTLLHFSENGGSRSLLLAKEAVSKPISEGVIDVGGQKFVFPLPKYSFHKEGQNYLTFASDDEWQDYFHKELPGAGWRYVEQVDRGHFFESGDVKICVYQSFYLGTSINDFSVSIEAP
jgi:hypothetical protein